MKLSEPTKVPLPEVVENYRDLEPPAQVRKAVENLLKAVPQKYLAGLKTIVLTDQGALTRDQRRQKIWGRTRRYPLAESRGLYYEATNRNSATVWLFVDNTMRAWPRSLWKFPFLCYIELSEVLYHEIGHHIHAVHRPEYEGKENVAEDWSLKLWGRFLRRHYWYMMPLLYPLAKTFNLFKKIKRHFR